MKDFYDIWLLSRQYNFDGDKLSAAIRLTFNQRSTDIPANLALFTDTFKKSKQVQWTAFRKRLNLEHIPDSFDDIVNQTEKFLSPLLFKKKSLKWKAPGPWLS